MLWRVPVAAVAIVLVFAVAVLEFRGFRAPIAIVTGAVLSAFGIVHKNGILVIDHVEQLRAAGVGLTEAVVTSGRRRLRPVLMTSLAAAAGMLLSLVATPTAYHLLMAGRARDRSHRGACYEMLQNVTQNP